MPEQTAQVFDLVVVGGSPGGHPVAIRAAQLGLRTALVDRERPGGVCRSAGHKRRERVTGTLTDGVFLLPEVPGRIVIIGASAVGAEWATMSAASSAPAPAT